MSLIPYLVVGLGQTGFSCVRYLVRAGLPVVVNDSRTNPPYLSACTSDYPNVDVVLGQWDLGCIQRAAHILMSPGIDPGQAVFHGRPLMSDIDLFVQNAQAPIIAITGSNGKSTVTTWVHEMALQSGLSAELGGNIGIPVLDLLHKPVPDVYVLELSSFQLALTQHLQRHVAVVLNISEDHLDRHGSLSNYANIKQGIYQHCGVAVINKDDPLSHPKALHQPVVSFGVEGDVHIRGGMLCFQDQEIIPRADMVLRGAHHAHNALAAAAIGCAAGFSLEGIARGLRQFKGLPHRCAWVGCAQGVDFFNDSKGTNIAATIAAIQSVAGQVTGKIVLIAGGQAKTQDFSSVLPFLEAHVAHVVLLGQDQALLYQAFKHSTTVHKVKDMADAVQCAYDLAVPGDAVLLSPMCASFDQFRNFEHRGEVFQAQVMRVMN